MSTGIQEEMDLHINRLLSITTAKAQFRVLIIKIHALRLAYRELKANRREAYEQLMLLEEEIEAPKDAFVVLDRIAKIKGLLVVALLLTTVAAIKTDEGRRVVQRSARQQIREEALA